MSAPLLHGFAPLVGANPHTLILGNAPSVLALQRHQYYGNPRNAFWRIMAELFGVDAEAPYAQRVAALTDRGYAVWDVLRSCRRAGSLDSAVEPASMVPNDFRAFFTAYPGIARVFFNGAAAEANFRRLVPDPPALRYARLPSTSPAQTMRFPAKLTAWRAVL
ncbi:DNA-deoxyinosine glycosylase [Mycobacterium sp. MYCO198283]|uniref:DNA-deoxyinosine glycosylase n=1 Tax=Mycobacterium sp. MYCO198283 TaxID=2883505 RepID=UPI001E3E3CBE|nr:DNA-deoxyinosine glycosylase [Mycobacterium sp. MYCO198283]MCG5430737.1 DNA-deoxyinosine glycosylase [Mycobacterium sp. MYCO198283]